MTCDEPADSLATFSGDEKRILIVILLSLGVIGVVLIFFGHRQSELTSSEAIVRPQPTPILTASPVKQAENLSAPPRPSGQMPLVTNPEPQRTLTGTTTREVETIEGFLSPGHRISVYPVSEREQRAALATADLPGDGRTETVLVYETSSTENKDERSLFLAVLLPTGNKLNVVSSARLEGGLIYVSLLDDQAIPFAVRDVTGDGRSEVIVSSGVGASLGGALQIYSFDGSSLHQIALARGHILHLEPGRPGKPAEVLAQSRYESKPRRYRWNGQKFERS